MILDIDLASLSKGTTFVGGKTCHLARHLLSFRVYIGVYVWNICDQRQTYLENFNTLTSRSANVTVAWYHMIKRWAVLLLLFVVNNKLKTSSPHFNWYYGKGALGGVPPPLKINFIYADWFSDKRLFG